MATMIRKQVYLEPGQDVAVKKLAEALGTTEADIIRRAVDLLLSETERQHRAEAAWEGAQTLMEARAAQVMPNTAAGERAWIREELYTERLERNG